MGEFDKQFLFYTLQTPPPQKKKIKLQLIRVSQNHLYSLDLLRTQFGKDRTVTRMSSETKHMHLQPRHIFTSSEMWYLIGSRGLGFGRNYPSISDSFLLLLIEGEGLRGHASKAGGRLGLLGGDRKSVV